MPDVIEIRGEIYLTPAEFQRINAAREEEGLELYANPRNLAAGTIKLLDPREVARRRLEIVLYGAGFCEPAGPPGRRSPATRSGCGPGACPRSKGTGGRAASTRSGRPCRSWTGCGAISPTGRTGRS